MQDLIDSLERCVRRSVFVSERMGEIRWNDYRRLVPSEWDSHDPSVTYLRPRETPARVRFARCARSICASARGGRRYERAGGSVHEGTADRTRGLSGPCLGVAPDLRCARRYRLRYARRPRVRPGFHTRSSALPDQRPPTRRSEPSLWTFAQPRPSFAFTSAKVTSRPASRSPRPATTAFMNARSSSTAS